jgi:Cu/Ag efflux protein CusF
MTTSRIAFVAAIALAVSSGAWAQEDQTTGKILKIDQANGKITLQHRQGGTTASTATTQMLTDEYQIGQGLPLGGFKPGDEISYTEARVGGVWTVTKMNKR